MAENAPFCTENSKNFLRLFFVPPTFEMKVTPLWNRSERPRSTLFTDKVGHDPLRTTLLGNNLPRFKTVSSAYCDVIT